MLFFSHTKTLESQGIFQGFTDHHSHILPGVDDGVQTPDESLRILQAYEALGVKEVWLTPHIQEFMPNTTEKLNIRFSELQESYRGSIQLHLSAEYMLDSLFLDRLKSNDLLLHSLPDESEQLLVETSYLNPPMNLWNILNDIMSRGIRPILAHPERYLYMKDEDYDRLNEMGIILQLNIPSLLGYYGKAPQQRAHKILSKGYYSLRGTDIHTENLIHLFKTKKVQIFNNLLSLK